MSKRAVIIALTLLMFSACGPESFEVTQHFGTLHTCSNNFPKLASRFDILKDTTPIPTKIADSGSLYLDANGFFPVQWLEVDAPLKEYDGGTIDFLTSVPNGNTSDTYSLRLQVQQNGSMTGEFGITEGSQEVTNCRADFSAPGVPAQSF